MMAEIILEPLHVNQLFLWPCLIAMSNDQRVLIICPPLYPVVLAAPEGAALLSIQYGQLLIFAHPMSGTRHHLSNSRENSASISIICFLRLNIHEHPAVSNFGDFLQIFSVFSHGRRKKTPCEFHVFVAGRTWVPCPFPSSAPWSCRASWAVASSKAPRRRGRTWIPREGWENIRSMELWSWENHPSIEVWMENPHRNWRF